MDSDPVLVRRWRRCRGDDLHRVRRHQDQVELRSSCVGCSRPGSQLALDVVFDYHTIVTDRDEPMLELEADHRAHTVVELAIRDLKAGGLAHVPSGILTANAAWLALAVLATTLAAGPSPSPRANVGPGP